MSYYFSKMVGGSFEEAVERVTEELKKEGFGMQSRTPISRGSHLKCKINSKPS